MQTILNAEARRTQYTFMMCEKLVVSFVCCSSAGPDSRKRNGCCANDGQLFTQRNSLYRMQIGGQLKMRNDKIDARDESVRRVCIDTSCTMNWKWHVVYIHLYIGRYIYIYFLWRLRATTIKQSLPLSKRKSICTQIAIHMQLHVAHIELAEKYAFVSRSINANVKIIQMDGTRYSSVVCYQNVLYAFDGERGNLLLLGKCKNISCGDGNGTAISIAINKWIEVSCVFTWSIVMRIRHPTDSIPNWLCNVVAAEANEKNKNKNTNIKSGAEWN